MSGAASYVFIGGVDVSHACLEALCEIDRPPALAVSYDESKAHLSGYADFGELAERFGFPHLRTRNVNDPQLVEQITGLEPALIYVIGWSQLVKRPILDAPSMGCVGIHPTRLPEGRGRAPIPWTIINGLHRSASTMFFLTEGVDDGDIVGTVDVPVEAREEAGTLYAKHRAAHVELVRRHTDDLLAGTAARRPQDHAAATYWPKRNPEDGRLDWARSTEELDRLVRAVTHPFPGAFAEAGGERWMIWRAEPAEGPEADPGTVAGNDDRGGVTVATGDGWLRILESSGPGDWPARF
jgi:methionyl-tRNA formyltransferase